MRLVINATKAEASNTFSFDSPIKFYHVYLPEGIQRNSGNSPSANVLELTIQVPSSQLGKVSTYQTQNLLEGGSAGVGFLSLPLITVSGIVLRYTDELSGKVDTFANLSEAGAVHTNVLFSNTIDLSFLDIYRRLDLTALREVIGEDGVIDIEVKAVNGKITHRKLTAKEALALSFVTKTSATSIKVTYKRDGVLRTRELTADELRDFNTKSSGVEVKP